MATVEPHYHRSNVLAEFVNRTTSEIRILTDPDGITKGGFDATRIIATTMRDLARSADDLLRLLVLGALERDTAFFFNVRSVRADGGADADQAAGGRATHGRARARRECAAARDLRASARALRRPRAPPAPTTPPGR